MRLIRRVSLAIIIAASLLAHGASYADADGGSYATLTIGTATADLDPGDPGLPPDR